MGFFTGSQIQPVQAPMMDPALSQAFFWALGSQAFQPDGKGGYTFYNNLTFDPTSEQAKEAKAALTVPTNPLLQAVQQAYSPGGGAGQNYLSALLGGGGPQQNPQIQTAMGNMQQYGVQGGYPGDLMHNMAQFGGTGAGAPGFDAMRAALAYGAPSQAGQFVSNMAQFGTPSAAGSYMAQRAAGGGPAMSFLQPFLQMAQPYAAPSMQRQTLYRNAGAGFAPVRY